MNLPAYTLWIFMLIVVLLVMVFLFPSNFTIFLGAMMSSFLIVFQAYLILRDSTSAPSDTYDV